MTVITSADRRQAEILLLFLTSGVFCAATSTLTSLGAVAGKPLFAGLAADFRSMISSIPFPHEGTAPLVNALLTGDRSSLDDSVMNSFRDSGASHILALSGLHLGIIYGILLKVTSIFGKHPTVKAVRSLIIISLCGIYTLATGASPSLVRAFLFILVNETARLTHRSNNPLRVYCAALFIQTAINPQVISSTGFQLSYLAMAGIFLLYPALKKWYPQEEAAGDMLIEKGAGLTENDGLEGVMIDKDADLTESDGLEGMMIDKGCCRARRCRTSWMKTIVSAQDLGCGCADDFVPGIHRPSRLVEIRNFSEILSADESAVAAIDKCRHVIVCQHFSPVRHRHLPGLSHLAYRQQRVPASFHHEGHLQHVGWGDFSKTSVKTRLSPDKSWICRIRP